MPYRYGTWFPRAIPWSKMRKTFYKNIIHPKLKKDLNIYETQFKQATTEFLVFEYKGEVIFQSDDDFGYYIRNLGAPLYGHGIINTFRNYTFSGKPHFSLEDNISREISLISLLDKRVGKRTLQHLVNDGFFAEVLINQDERLERICRLRFKLDGIIVPPEVELLKEIYK